MNLSAEGTVVYEGETHLSEDHLRKVSVALASASAEGTASLVPWFGPTVAGEEQFVHALELDLSRALLGSLSYTWERAFVSGEHVGIKVYIEKVFDKGSNRFGVVVSEFTDKAGSLIQRQSATFIENMGA